MSSTRTVGLPRVSCEVWKQAWVYRWAAGLSRRLEDRSEVRLVGLGLVVVIGVKKRVKVTAE